MTKVTLFALCMSLFSYAFLVLESKASGNSLRGGARRLSSIESNDDLPRRLLLKDLAPKEIQTPLEANNHPLNWVHDIFDGPGKSTVADVLDDHDDQTTLTASYIIEFDDNVQDIEGAAKIIANWLGRRPGHVYKQLVHGFSISDIPTSMVAKIASIEGVARVELDDAISLDGELVIARKFDENGNDPNSRFLQERQEIPWGITRVQGGKTYNGTNVVFVIDTGVDLNHPDLNVHPTLCFSLAGDSCNDDNGHGSHVSGTIAAIDNGFGVVGVAAGATIVPVKVLNAQGKGYLGGLIQALEWVTEHAKIGDVVNISMGSKISNDSVDKAVRRAAEYGLLIALSAGNDAGLASERSPSRTNHRNIFTVAATTQQDELAPFSNIGKPPVDCAAPGVDILSTFKSGQYATMQGTSMAAPHAAGALLLGYRPSKNKKKNREAPVDANGKRYPFVSIKSSA